MLLANFNRKEHLRHRAVSLRQHGFLVLYCGSTSSTGHSLSAYGRQAFAVASPTAWNSLSDDLRDPTLSTDSFRRLLKTRLLHRIRGIALYALYKLTTYLLTYIRMDGADLPSPSRPQ